MIKHIIREYEPDCSDAEWYFDNDGFTSAAGDYCYNIFITTCDYGRTHCGFNKKEYEKVCSRANELAEIFDDIKNRGYYSDWYKSYKDAMIEYNISYTPKRCHDLKEVLNDFDDRYNEQIAEYLTVVTGKKWEVACAHGYSQGDYCEIIYCTHFYTDEAIEEIGDIYLGCYKSFEVIDLDESGEEVDSCRGFLVADSMIHNYADSDNEYKRIVCGYEDLNPEETQLEMLQDVYIDGRYDAEHLRID